MSKQDKFEEMRKKKEKILEEIDTSAFVYSRMGEIARNSSAIIEKFDREFEQATKLDKKDVSFLFLAIALQCIRLVFQPKLNYKFEKVPRSERHSASEDGRIEKKLKNEIARNNTGNNIVSKRQYPDIVSMYLHPVPYDAMENTARIVIPGVSEYGKNLYGGNHHSATWGHDPIAGYLFGTINILTSTISFRNPQFQTCDVILRENTLLNPQKYSGQYVGDKDFSLDAIIAMVRETSIEDPHRIPAAVGRHVLHLQSDQFCKDGLPFPFISAEKAQNLIRDDWNSNELKRLIDELATGNTFAVDVQALISSIINVIIETMHKLTYRDDSGLSKDVFSVKTHRILELSNIISSTSNVIYVAIGSVAGICTENGNLTLQSLERLDIGGLMVTIHRIATDENFIKSVKMEFLKDHWNDYVTKELEK